MNHVDKFYLQRSEGVRSLRTRVTDCGEQPYRCCKLNPGPLQEQQVLLNIEITLQPNEILQQLIKYFEHFKRSVMILLVTNLAAQTCLKYFFFSSVDQCTHFVHRNKILSSRGLKKLQPIPTSMVPERGRKEQNTVIVFIKTVLNEVTSLN